MVNVSRIIARLGHLFDPWVEDCPLKLTSPNAPSNRDILGTVLLSVLSGHQRYAHVTTLRSDSVNSSLLGMEKIVSEDSLRRALLKIEEVRGISWLQNHLSKCLGPEERWYRILSKSLEKYLRGYILKPPNRLPAPA